MAWLIGKPRWFICVVEGLGFAILIGLLGVLQRNALSQVVLGAAFGGVLFGVLLGYRTATGFARLLDVAGSSLPLDQRTAAVKVALGKRAVSERRQVMRAAHQVAVFRLDQTRRQYRLTLIVFGALLVVSIVATIVFSAAFTLLALICLVSLLVWLRRPQRLERRATTLAPVVPARRGKKG